MSPPELKQGTWPLTFHPRPPIGPDPPWILSLLEKLDRPELVALTHAHQEMAKTVLAAQKATLDAENRALDAEARFYDAVITAVNKVK